MVVPTATTRRPAARAAAMRARAARSTTNGSSCSGWSSRRSTVTGLKVARPTCSVRCSMATPAARSASSSSGREVQPGGRRRGRALQAGVDGLVALGVGERRPDVGRQGRLAVAREQTGERLGRPAAGPTCQRPSPSLSPTSTANVSGAASLRSVSPPRRRPRASTSHVSPRAVGGPPGRPRLARRRRTRRPRHARRPRSGQTLQEQQLDPPAGRLAKVRPGRDHAGVVAHQHVAAAQQAGKLAEAPVVEPQAGAGAARHEQPRGVARLGGTWAISSAGSA